jgi:integrase
MARKPQLTDRGLLAESFGRRPFVVTLREEKEPGSNVILDYTLDGKRKKPTIGYAVRTASGKRWIWNDAALERAREAAEDRSAELRLHRLRADVLDTATLTFGQAVALYTNQKTGGVPTRPQTRQYYLKHLRTWTRLFGHDTPWNQIKPAAVLAHVREMEHGGHVPGVMNEARVLRACVRWLRGPAGIEALKDPMVGFPWKRLRDAHTPHRPRYTPEQLAAIVKVRHDVDPRFALFLALVDDSGARSKAVRMLWRSMVDMQLDQPPTAHEAPNGWLVFPALKGQRAVLHLLTAFERRELGAAFDGYLSKLEAAWLEERSDYPLFPGARLRDKKDGVIDPNQGRAYQAADPTLFADFLKDAEALAGVAHVRGRGFHGARRAVSDHLMGALGLDGLTTAMGWSSRTTPEQIYVDRRRMPDRVAAREAMEEKRRPKDAPEP